MDDATLKAYSVEVFEEGIMYYHFFEDDFKNAEKRALEFVEKGMSFSTWIYDREDTIEIVKWDDSLDQMVFILTYYGKCKGYEIVCSS